MSSFTSELKGEFLPTKNLQFKLLEPLTYWHGDKDNPTIEEVPEGFVTDFASIPRVLWSIIGSPASGLYRNPSVLHDFWYKNNKYSRRKCDRLFLGAMKVAGVGYIKRKTIYYGVRAGGWVGYNRYKKLLTS